MRVHAPVGGAVGRIATVALLAVAACANAGGDAGDGGVPPPADADPNAPDADPNAPDARPSGPDAEPLGGPCDPIAQDCGPGRKCAWIWDDPSTGEGHVGCALNGTINVGTGCSPPSMAGGTDDCIAGAHCVFGECHAICSIDPPAACGGGGGCVGVTNLDFDVCLPACDPLTQDCDSGRGCYLTSMGPVCADVISDVPPGDFCNSLNDCQAGAGCFTNPFDPDCSPDPTNPDCTSICLSYCDFATYPNVNDPEHCLAGEGCRPISGEDLYGACF